MNSFTRHVFTAFGLSVVALLPASGATLVPFVNDNYAPGDLILTFQNPGGSTNPEQTVMVNLGNTASRFRDASANLLNITNVGATLASTFGANWWESPTLFVGTVGVWGTSPLGSGLQNGDPQRTLYVSRAREIVGTEGAAGSTPWQILGDTDMTTGAGRITQVGNVLENSYTTPVAVSPTSESQIDNQNPFVQAGIQGTAYGVFPGGVQDQFASGAFGSFAGIPAEAALDLYRLQGRNDIAGQHGFGDATRLGAYEGTLILDQAGNVSFIVVPEPTTGLLLASGLLIGAIARRRPLCQPSSN